MRGNQLGLALSKNNTSAIWAHRAMDLGIWRFHTRRTFVQILMRTLQLSHFVFKPMRSRCPLPAAAARPPPPSHEPSTRCPAKSFPPPPQTTTRRPSPSLDMSTSTSSVGPPSLRLITLPSRASAALISPFPLLTLRHRWFHIKVCLVAGVGFFTDAYVVV